MNESNRGVYIGIIVFILAAGAALWGLSSADRDEVPAEDNEVDNQPAEQISWDEQTITAAGGTVLVASDDVTGSIQVSEESEFGAAGPFSSAALSSDAAWIAFTTSGAAHSGGWLYRMSSEEIQPVAFQYGGGLEVLAWSPDARFAAFSVASPSGADHITVVGTENTDGYVSEISQQIEAEAQAGMSPPFTYEFTGWDEPHTLCYSFEEQPEECVDVTELFSADEETAAE